MGLKGTRLLRRHLFLGHFWLLRSSQADCPRLGSEAAGHQFPVQTDDVSRWGRCRRAAQRLGRL